MSGFARPACDSELPSRSEPFQAEQKRCKVVSGRRARAVWYPGCGSAARTAGSLCLSEPPPGLTSLTITRLLPSPLTTMCRAVASLPSICLLLLASIPSLGLAIAARGVRDSRLREQRLQEDEGGPGRTIGHRHALDRNAVHNQEPETEGGGVDWMICAFLPRSEQGGG
jgi:hypothetical protein